jgi:hypothetical protein
MMRQKPEEAEMLLKGITEEVLVIRFEAVEAVAGHLWQE